MVVPDGTPTYEVSNLRYEEGSASTVAGRAADVRKEQYGLAGLTIALP